MKVENMTSSKGNKIANQFIIINGMVDTKGEDGLCEFQLKGDMFQSYHSNIAFRGNDGKTYLDSYYWDYSTTTGKYRNQFLGETKKETQAKIDSGEYILTNLN